MILASSRQVYCNTESKYISSSSTVIDKKICFRVDQVKMCSLNTQKLKSYLLVLKS